MINHSPEAVYASQSLANFFVSETRRNSHHRNTSDPAARLFWDYDLSSAAAPEFQQCYIVPKSKAASSSSSEEVQVVA